MVSTEQCDYDLKVFKYRQCRWCGWAMFMSDYNCPKCLKEVNSTVTFMDYEDEDDIRYLFTRQTEWIQTNTPTLLEIKEALELARDLYRLTLL